MRFLRKSLTGLFLLGATLALFAFAFSMVRSAIENKDDGQRRGGGPRERIFAVNVVPFEAGQQTPILQVFGEVQANAVWIFAPQWVEPLLNCIQTSKMGDRLVRETFYCGLIHLTLIQR